METGPEISQSPVIFRPTDEKLLEKLRCKQQEYLGRMGNEYTHPEQAIVMGIATGNLVPLDSYVKHKLLTKVLDEGSVETWQFSLDMFDDPVLANIPDYAISLVYQKTGTACGVIEAYCSGKLTSLAGGTGLNQDDY